MWRQFVCLRARKKTKVGWKNLKILQRINCIYECTKRVINAAAKIRDIYLNANAHCAPPSRRWRGNHHNASTNKLYFRFIFVCAGVESRAVIIVVVSSGGGVNRDGGDTNAGRVENFRQYEIQICRSCRAYSTRLSTYTYIYICIYTLK